MKGLMPGVTTVASAAGEGGEGLAAGGQGPFVRAPRGVMALQPMAPLLLVWRCDALRSPWPRSLESWQHARGVRGWSPW